MDSPIVAKSTDERLLETSAAFVNNVAVENSPVLQGTQAESADVSEKDVANQYPSEVAEKVAHYAARGLNVKKTARPTSNSQPSGGSGVPDSSPPLSPPMEPWFLSGTESSGQLRRVLADLVELSKESNRDLVLSEPEHHLRLHGDYHRWHRPSVRSTNWARRRDSRRDVQDGTPYHRF